MFDGYKTYVFIENDEISPFKDTVHQVCVAHGGNNFMKAFKGQCGLLISHRRLLDRRCHNLLYYIRKTSII